MENKVCVQNQRIIMWLKGDWLDPFPALLMNGRGEVERSQGGVTYYFAMIERAPILA